LTSILALAQVRLLNAIADLRDREEGQGLTEYVVLLGAVVVMVIALVGILTTNLTTYITNLISGLPTP
jgi:Flp pilus assembly pilin Flp